MISQFKKLQRIPLFQDVAVSKADTIIQNLTTADQITPNKQFYFLFFSWTFQIMHFFYLSLDNVLPMAPFDDILNKKCRIDTKKGIVKTYACSDSRNYILNNFIKCIGNWRTPIGYVSSEDKNIFKLVDKECTISHSQYRTEKIQEQVFFYCL